MSEGTICQDLHALTVAICRLDDQTIVGTGFIVSSDPALILTCGHVIEEVCSQKRQIGLKVGVYFRNNPSPQRYQSAIVVSCLPDFDDDIALLKLEQGTISLQHKLVELAIVDHYQYRNFISYGYGHTNKDPYTSAPIEGRILGPVEAIKLNLHKNRIYLKTETSILEGHSGSPVLDQTLNRIVGIIIDSNGSNAGHATDCAILTLENFNSFGLLFSDTPVPKLHARTPRYGVIENIKEDFSVTDLRSFGIPEPTYEVYEWTGREKLLNALTENWNHPIRRITALIGFGGEGKSSLVRRWIELTSEKSIFWWSFYKNSDVDAFFEAGFQYISKGMYTNVKRETRAEKLAAFLYTGKYLFVLDGFEVMQYNNLDSYGEVINENIQLFLEYFAAPSHNSHCIITSRLPLHFSHYTTFTQYDVDHLSREDGCALLRNFGVQDNDNKLSAVVQAWGGHALALSLVGSYLRVKYEGKILNDFTISIKDIHGNDRRREQVARMLARYENNLIDESDKDFLLIFSVFRRPVNTNAVSAILQCIKKDVLINRLVDYKILRFDTNAQEFSIHPLIRDYYQNNLINNSNLFQYANTIARDYYFKQMPEILDDHSISVNTLYPVVEAIFHSCIINEYDAAYTIYSTPIYIHSINKSRQRGYKISELFIHWLGAYNIAQDLLKSFFSMDNTNSSPYLQSITSKSTVLYDLGQSSMYLGNFDEAIQQYRLAIDGYEVEGEWSQSARVNRHLAVLFIQRGELSNAFQAAERALHLAEEFEGVQKLLAEDNIQVIDSEIYQDNPVESTIAAAALLGYIDALRGEIDLYFAYMRDLCPDITLYREAGLWYANYLEKNKSKGNVDDLVRSYIDKGTYLAEKSQFHRILANTTTEINDKKKIQELFKISVDSGRESSRRDVLIEALIARGKWLVQQGSLVEAKEDLDEALTYSQNVYRIYEADNRIGLAWLYHVWGDQQAAIKEANHAELISRDIGYSWGGRDAQELVKLIASD